MKRINKKSIVATLLLCCAGFLQAQFTQANTPNTDSIFSDRNIIPRFDPNKRIDGVVAIVGDHVILDSDIDKTYLEIESNRIDVSSISRCEILGSLMEDKFYAHHAIQDSITVNDDEIKSLMENDIEFMTRQLGGMDRVIKYYRKKNEEDFRADMFEIFKTNQLTQRMRNKIVGDVEITPEEVRQFFVKIPKDSLPVFGVELEVAQIILEPKISADERQKVIDKLNEIREDVLNGSSFFSKAVLYSEDPGSKSNGGYYKINRKSPMVKEFKDVAFSLQEGEISKPFETEFGYHIIMLEKIKGQELELRHILIMPKVTEVALKETRERAINLREKIVSGEITFANAARSESDEKETRANGGILINPQTQDTRFELTKMDPALYSQISNLKDGEVSLPLIDQTQTGMRRYKLITITNRYEEHQADYSLDYTKIKEMALQNKRLEVIKKWFDEKMPETYINVDASYKNCKFKNNWLQR
ncbi:MAG: peptidylprolyl isomerase [Bacteroidota bacterium]|nr:peptidylprolyl isomerase [Bacteroidota bacterium]